MKENKWRIELNEHQLRLIAKCVEDCHRFIAGQMELSNSTACLKHGRHLGEELSTLQAFVTPLLERGASYGWNGGSCPDKNQRKFIAETGESLLPQQLNSTDFMLVTRFPHVGHL